MIKNSFENRRWYKPALAFALGLAAATGHVPLSMFYIAVIAFAGLFVLFDQSASPREAFFTGWAGGIGYFLFSLFWIVEPFLVQPERHAWMAPFAVLLLPSFLGLFWAGAFWAAAKTTSGIKRTMLAAVMLAIAETSRAYVFTGFPWALVGYIWVDTPIMQLASLIGPHGLTLLTTLAAVFLGIGALRKGIWYIAPTLSVVILGLGWFWGGSRIPPSQPNLEAHLKIRLVQPNAEQGLKWNPDKAQEFLRVLVDNTAAPAEGRKPDLILWPETAYPYSLNGSEAVIKNFVAAAGHRPVAFGAMRREGPIYFNSLVVTDGAGEISDIYDKYHLAPFGEYVPFGDFLGHFGIKGMAVNEGNGFSSGEGLGLIDFGPLGKAQPLICYEAIFPQHLNIGERADWIFQITNDAWFGKLTGPYQHLAQAQMRAVEQGLPLARSANTGVSAMINAYGQVETRLELGERGFLDARLPSALPPTLFARTGNWPIFLILLILMIGLILPLRRN